MSTLGASLLSIAVSLCVLALLAWRDPERLRASARGQNTDERSLALNSALRRVLSATALAPGAMLAVFGESAALLIWAGVLLASGWALAFGLANARGSWSQNGPTARP